jgi:excisionase family DNA binding protein
MQKLLHPVDEARRILSLGRTKFYDEVNAGRLVLVKAGGKSLVPQSAIDRYVETLIAEAAADKAA